LPEGTIWRAEVEQSTLAVSFLEGRSEVRSVTLSADSLKIHTTKETNAQQLKSLLGDGGFLSRSIKPLHGTLEDVFLWLAGAG
jgi:hypothetical protein